MSAELSPQETPEWAAARNDWRAQADASLQGLHDVLKTAEDGHTAREAIYAPVHDIAGLAPVFEYHLLGNVARTLMESLRGAPDPLDHKTLVMCQTYITTMSALHARDIRGEVGPDGEEVLAKLAQATS